MRSSHYLFKSFIVCILLVSFFITNPSFGQMTPAEKLAAQGPKDTLFFIASSGLDHIKPSFDQSAMGKLWNDTATQQFVKQIQTQIETKINEQPDAQQTIEFYRIFKQVIRYPFIFGVSEAKGDIPVSAFFVVDAEMNKDALKAITDKFQSEFKDQLTEQRVGTSILHRIDDDQMPVLFGWHSNYFVFLVNDPGGNMLQSFRPGRYVSRRLSPLKDLEANGDAIVMLFNWAKTKQIVMNQIPPDEKNMIEKVMNGTGLNSIETIKLRAGFSGPDLLLDVLAETGSSQAGLFDCIEPVDINFLDSVDSRVSRICQNNINLVKLYDTIMGLVKDLVPPDQVSQIEATITGFEQQLQIKIRDGLLANLKGPFNYVTFAAASVSQIPSGGTALIAGLDNTEVFEKNLVTLEQFAVQLAQNNLNIETNTRQDGSVVHSWVIPALAMLQITPSWSIVDNKLVFAQNAQTAEVLINHIKSKEGKSIRSLTTFKDLETKLPENVLGLNYTDTGRQFKGFMTQMQQTWPLFRMGMQSAGLNLPALLPDLSHHADSLGPSCQYIWKDKPGYRLKYKGPGIEVSVGSPAGAAAAFAVLMPALNRTKQKAQQVVSQTNLKGLGLACQIYANDYDGKLPDNLQVLIKECDVSPKTLISPRSGTETKGNDYILIPGLNIKMKPDTVLIYENPEIVPDGMVNVLYLDGHVEFIPVEQLMQQLQKK